jgi:NADH-quinone oxidoreductase subunit M
MLWLYQRMFFGNIENPKNKDLPDMTGREWAYMTPLVILSLWIGVYPKTFVDYIQKPVAAVVRHVRPDYPIPGMPPTAEPATPARAAAQTQQSGAGSQKSE